MTCAPRSRRSMPRGGVRSDDASCRTFSLSCANRRPRGPALSVSQQDRQGQQAHPRDARDIASRRRGFRWCLRQIPIWNGDLIAGFVDLALERAFIYREHKASKSWPRRRRSRREKEARFSDAGKLADHDDALMEQLLEEYPAAAHAVFDDLARECAKD